MLGGCDPALRDASILASSHRSLFPLQRLRQTLQQKQVPVCASVLGVCDPAVPHEHAGSCRWPRCSRRSGRAAAPAQAPSNGILSFSMLLSYCFFYVGFYIMFLFSLSLNDVDVASWRIMVGCRPTNPHWTCLARPVRSREHSWRFQIHLHLFVHLVASHKALFLRFCLQPAWPPRMQRGIAKLILNGYTDRLFLLFLLLFVPSSDISLGIAMASMDWARPSISADLGAILSLLGSPDAHSRPSSGPCDANHLHSQLMKN